MQDKRLLGWQNTQVAHGTSGGNAARAAHRVLALYGVRHDGERKRLLLSNAHWARMQQVLQLDLWATLIPSRNCTCSLLAMYCAAVWCYKCHELGANQL